MVLALFPTLAGVVFFIYYLIRNLRNLFFRGMFEEEPWTHILVLIGFFSLIILYSWEIRDYSSMKAIFIFPALISIVFCVSQGLNFMFFRISNKILRSAMHGVLGSLVIFYVLDIAFLILQLARDRQWL